MEFIDLQKLVASHDPQNLALLLKQEPKNAFFQHLSAVCLTSDKNSQRQALSELQDQLTLKDSFDLRRKLEKNGLTYELLDVFFIKEGTRYKKVIMERQTPDERHDVVIKKQVRSNHVSYHPSIQKYRFRSYE